MKKGFKYYEGNFSGIWRNTHTVVAILSIILVVTAVIGSDATGIVGKTFSDLITNFSNHANMSVK